MEKMTTVIRKLMEGDDILIRMGVYDGLTAKIAERAGFKALAITGFGVSASLGRPDVGLTTMTEMVERARHIVDSVNIPVCADADTGYGNAMNVYRTIREFESAGAAMIMIEDQVFPKRCGSMMGKDVISVDEMTGKIRAALDARRDPDLMILARTDAVDVLGREAALERALAYEEAGADAVTVINPGTSADMRRLNSSVHIPSIAIIPEAAIQMNKYPLKNPRELQEVGFRCVAYPTTILFYVTKRITHLLAKMKNDGLTKEIVSETMEFEQVTDLLGLPEYYALEKKYLQIKK